jgi:RNA polymerase sigma-70 factor (ECF subfamily)
MEAITDDQRRAIHVLEVEGIDFREIAQITAVYLGTVKTRRHRGRLALRDLLADQMDHLR